MSIVTACAYDSLQNITLDSPNTFILSAIKSCLLDACTTYKLIFAKNVNPYKFASAKHGHILAESNKICIIFVTEAGSKSAFGIRPRNTIIVVDGQIFRRITWADIKLTDKRFGMKAQSDNRLVWYIQKINVTTDTLTKIYDHIGKAI